MKWQEVLKGSANPNFFSLVTPGVVNQTRHVIIKIPKGKRLSLLKLREITQPLAMTEVKNIVSLAELLREDMIILVQMATDGKWEEMLSIGQYLETGMIAVNTIQGPMLYNGFGTLWLATSDEEIPEPFKSKAQITEISESEDVFE